MNNKALISEQLKVQCTEENEISVSVSLGVKAETVLKMNTVVQQSEAGQCAV